MAKDPAFLFYPGDYISGTMHLDFECKGAYVDLLMMQFNKDHMTIHMIKHVLGHKFEHIWCQISDKFQTDGINYWNQRLKAEKEKRLRYSESRRSNRNKKKDMLNHMSNHMENENENCIVVKTKKQNNDTAPKFSGNFKAQSENLFAGRMAKRKNETDGN